MYLVIDKDLVVDRDRVMVVTDAAADSGQRDIVPDDSAARTVIILDDGRRLLTHLGKETVVRRLESGK